MEMVLVMVQVMGKVQEMEMVQVMDKVQEMEMDLV